MELGITPRTSEQAEITSEPKWMFTPQQLKEPQTQRGSMFGAVLNIIVDFCPTLSNSCASSFSTHCCISAWKTAKNEKRIFVDHSVVENRKCLECFIKKVKPYRHYVPLSKASNLLCHRGAHRFRFTPQYAGSSTGQHPR